ncbi:uncharacterized protein LOC131223442 isoform X2 [Magnolia sinica]|uniref:uncharacterized protein LOC131223442 isoform X2 n=1 Tax=Magnolia sinica TaxID=86752 RepID=UPI00265B2D63|nr:uncharacterized protein LOC131223442 isoform X2 [Magnolia sinica]
MSQQSRASSKWKTFITWTPFMDKYTADILIEQVISGVKSNHDLRAIAMNAVAKGVGERFHVSVDVNNCRNRLQTFCKHFQLVKEALNKSGFGWDEERKYVIVEEVWKEFIKAIAAALACDQKQYHVALITHSAHKSLRVHLAARNISCFLISTPPVLSNHQDQDNSDSTKLSFSLQKKATEREHREECLSAMEKAFGDGPCMEGDFVVINFFALEGWSLAELFRVRCVVAAPYVVPYSAPSSFERRFRRELPLLYNCLQEAPMNMDPVTGLPMCHDWPQSPLLLYGFSKEIVECPGYWPSNVHVCGFWFLPLEWQFSCYECSRISGVYASRSLNAKGELCTFHADLQCFLETSNSCPPIFIGLSSIGSMGFLRNTQAFLLVLKAVLESTNYRFILFSSGYEPLDASIRIIAGDSSGSNQREQFNCSESGILLFKGRLFCFSGTIPYSWLFPRCAVAIHHGGSGSTAAAVHAGTPQIICPFMLDQFYWAERMFWLGVAPEAIQRRHLLPDNEDDTSITEAANALANAISAALSPKIKARASEIAERISSEDGVREALKVLKEHIIYPKKPEG